ncbi:MAG: Uma2 family endonuclease [Acidobacteriia bacterium]|nr:Uma2 family endonuclease [Terriglobia bacterium]
MGTVVAARMTFEEFERLPDGPEDLELLEGELVEMPPPERSHMKDTKHLFKLLDAAVEDRRMKQTEALGEVFMEMGYLLTSDPRSWLRPDVSITHANQPGGKYYEGAPLMVFDVVSGEDRATKLIQKVRLFLRHGAQEVWLIYPVTRDAYIYKAGMAAVVHEEQAIHSDLLPGIQIPFDQFLWKPGTDGTLPEAFLRGPRV